MPEPQEIPEVRITSEMGIWGNSFCIRCGACCVEYREWLHEQNPERDPPMCPNFQIREGIATCLAHESERGTLCKTFFCGGADIEQRLKYGGDRNLRAVAHRIGTTPKLYSIPTLLPGITSQRSIADQVHG